MKKLILDHVSDLVSNFLYYDRKEDEELPRGAIENAIFNEEISVEEMVIRFRNELIAVIYQD
jgi:hypothetical protein